MSFRCDHGKETSPNVKMHVPRSSKVNVTTFRFVGTEMDYIKSYTEEKQIIRRAARVETYPVQCLPRGFFSDICASIPRGVYG